MDTNDEEVVLYPLKSHDPEVKVLRVSRVSEGKLDNKLVHHIAGGPYKGIIVSKATQDFPSKDRPHVVREFLAHVHDTKNSQSNKDTKENRKVFMWFKDGNFDREQVADKFFKMLIDPDNFPKDYISFVKKAIVLTKAFHAIRMIELELSPAVEYLGYPPTSPSYRLSWIAKPENFSDEEENTKEVSPVQTKKPRPAPPPRRTSRTHITNATIHEDGDIEEKRPQNGEDRLSGQNQDAIPSTERSEEKLEPGKVQEIIIQKTVVTSSCSPPGSHDNILRDKSKLSGRQGGEDESQEVRDESPDKVVEVTITKQTVTKSMKSPVSANAPVIEDAAVVASHRLLVLTALEDAFPNALDAPAIASIAQLSQAQTDNVIKECSDKGLIQTVDGARWIRISTVRRKPKSESRSSLFSSSRISSSYGSKHDFQVVPQMPILPDSDQPRVAIITLLYCEKQAVDAMMENKTTYVRFKTEGEGQVYTVGSIGSHKVVSTKLIRVGTGQGATVSAGSLVTRLLGTFSKVQHVFLVGVGGGIPDYVKDSHHIRCGDVVISKPQFLGSPIYVGVTNIDSSEGNVSFSTQAWEPKDEALMKIISDLCQTYSARSMVNSSIHQYIQSGLGELAGHDMAFERPAVATDHLLKLREDGAWFEVEHPEIAHDSPRRLYPERPVLHFGSIGTGYDLLVQGGNDHRQEFALFNEIKAMDVGYQAAMEAINGNRTESFWMIRGIADYMDGMSGTEWQPYAALAAAAVTKSLLIKLSPIRI